MQKISTDLTGDPNVLLAGETLRYTITVKNIGNGNAVNVVLRDAVPANTTYVAGSTTLNGAAVADVAGLSPLVNGMPINSPADTTPGSMPADASSSQANVATITFDVVVNPNVVNGTVISNQGFVTATTSGIVDQPSDDPDTPDPNDPTRDIVGNLPLLYAEKRVALFGRSRLAGHRRSGRRAALHDHRAEFRRDPRDGRRPERHGSGEYHLRREFHTAQRTAGRPAGRRRIAARLGHQHQLSGSAGRSRPGPRQYSSSTCASMPARRRAP